MCALVLMTEPTFPYPARINSAIDANYHTISFPQSAGPAEQKGPKILLPA